MSARVLVVDDILPNVKLLEAKLSSEYYDVLTATSGEEALIKIINDSPDIVLLDVMMPGMDGFEVCKRIKENPAIAHIPVVMVTALTDASDKVRGLQAGADDFLTKPFDEGQLAARLRVAERILELHHRLYIQATHDYLTGVWNRATIMNFLESELQRGARRNTSTGVLIVDLDHFKRVNDTYGHAAGDEVLRKSASSMQFALRTYDKIGRYGGEEFLIIAPECDWSQIMGLAQRICDSISEKPVSTQSGGIVMTASLGVAVGNTRHDNGSALIAIADEALYRAKEKGRNRIEASNQKI